jgi:PadR family transcriptional regulator, regulatory protein AphA
MSLRHALLAILAVEPMTGYELTKHFDRSAAYVWHAPHSQIYPELRKLEEAGLVTADSVTRGDHGIKRTYSITDAGLDVLVGWVEEATAPTPERDAFQLKATYLEYGSFANARRQFEAHLDYHENLRRRWEVHVEALERRATVLMQRRLEVMPAELHEALVAYKVHVYRGLADRARHEARWARRGIALVDALSAAQAGKPGVA